MANEKRLIDANDFVKALENADADVCEQYPDCDCDWGFSRKSIEDLLQNIPTVDAVEVVRCKYCKHCKKYTNRFDQTQKERMLCKRIYDFAYGVEADDFCSYGERREGE